MITGLSKRISHFLYRNNIITEKDMEIYQYGFEIIFSTIIGLAIIIFIGIVLHMFWQSILYYLIFATIRQYTGGYHANSYLKCNLFFFVVSFFTLGMTKLCYTSDLYTITPHVLILIITILSIYKLAPIENQNKPMTDNELKRNHKFAMAMTSALVLISCILFNYQLEISVLIAFTLFSVSMLILLVKIKKGGAEDEQDQEECAG